MAIWFKSPRAYFLLAAIVCIFRIATALPIEHAGYMDASYTLHVAEQLACGRGFNEEVLWNYLDAPKALPHPSNLYWMPLPSILTAASFLVFGVSYHAAQVPFILLSLVPPLIAFYFARKIFAREDYAWMAGLLTAFSGFYTIYWIAPDNFTSFAVTADLALLWMVFAFKGKKRAWFVAGIWAGLSQLSRADGFLLLAVVPLLLFFSRRTFSQVVRGTLGATLGFLLVVSPWLARNFLATGSLLAPGGMQTLFLTNYDELFRYQVSDLTLARYLDWGWANIVLSKLNALGFDTLVLFFGPLQIFLVPFAIIGLWQLRRRAEFRPVLIYLALLLLAMTFVFTFPSVRGSMLHSSTALVAYLAVVAPVGLDAVVRWVARRRRHWNERSAQIFFRGGFVVFALGLAIFLYAQGVWGSAFGGTPTIALWNARDVEYRALASELDALGVPLTQPIMTVDPPSFFNETGRRSIYIPTDDMAAIFSAARQFDVHYLVLQYDHPRTLKDLYNGRGQVEGLVSVARAQDGLGRLVTLYEIVSH